MYCYWTSSYQEGSVGMPLTGVIPPYLRVFLSKHPKFQRDSELMFVYLILIELLTIIV
jgi:hypothetical protein